METVFSEEFTDKFVNGVQIIIELLKKNHSPSYDSSSSFSSLSSPFFDLLHSFFPTLRQFLLTPPPVRTSSLLPSLPLFFCSHSSSFLTPFPFFPSSYSSSVPPALPLSPFLLFPTSLLSPSLSPLLLFPCSPFSLLFLRKYCLFNDV